MCEKFRQFHTHTEIASCKDNDGKVIPELKDFAYAYVKSTTKEDLETNCRTLIDRPKPGGKDYIEGIWRQKGNKVIRYFTYLKFNIGCHFSQRIESYYRVLKEIVNG